ncbi:MAG: ATP-binding protein [Gemmatimonadota bacterium]
MSLRFRVIFLFFGFAILVMALLGAGDYIHSLRALEMVVDARNEAVAGQVARDLERAQTQARSELRTAAEAVSRAGAFFAAEDAARVLGESLAPFDEVRLVREGVTRWTYPLPGAGHDPCPGARDTLILRVPLPGGSPMALEGRAGPGAFLDYAAEMPGAVAVTNETRIVSSGGRVVHGSGCASVGDLVDPVVRSALGRVVASGGSAARSVRYSRGGEPWHAALAYVPGVELGVVVRTDENEYLAPFRESRRTYLSLALLVLFLSGLGFLILARMEFRSLRALTKAADQIELGNMRPWLPPPGEDEVGRLSLAFRKMTERLAESIRQVELNQKMAAVGELASYLSHEIRNPLSSIKLSLQSLHRDLRGGFIPDDADRVIEIALSEVKRLDGVVRTVLEVGRQPGEGAARTCAVHAVLEETLDVIRPKIGAQQIELEFAPRADDDVVVAEAEGLRSVWINLLVNAMDALEGAPDGRIRISTWSGASAPGELHVRIADNGPGVPPDIADSIFEPFFTTKRQGNGIGLPTALRTVQPWGGTITHEAVAAGRGAVFVVRLRLAADGREAPAPEPREPELEPALPAGGAHAA